MKREEILSRSEACHDARAATMRVLLDENLHRKLKLSFDEGVKVKTVTEMGWNGTRNGDLLRI